MPNAYLTIARRKSSNVNLTRDLKYQHSGWSLNLSFKKEEEGRDEIESESLNWRREKWLRQIKKKKDHKQKLKK